MAGLMGGWMFEQLGPRMMYEISALVSVVGVVGFLVMWLWLRKTDKDHTQAGTGKATRSV